MKENEGKRRKTKENEGKRKRTKENERERKNERSAHKIVGVELLFFCKFL